MMFETLRSVKVALKSLDTPRKMLTFLYIQRDNGTFSTLNGI